MKRHPALVTAHYAALVFLAVACVAPIVLMFATSLKLQTQIFNTGISFIFTSSDFLLPSITSALKAAGKYHQAGEPGHVILGGFDGDATAWQMLKDGYLDATGVQDVYFESQQCVRAILEIKAGKSPAPLIKDRKK